ncbi:hypothetical protein AAur_3177 [Paenarthrobacter aurescens TC1]|uniref:Uncharacterized protein n=1 Tax=Paenarthrobacter aurescens (strain TC1) TaxID=290340 RepID=A1R9G2_PAEAT|nr:hypothetical protein AAur_3177 [Paenarthrobacter aurescens TC1]
MPISWALRADVLNEGLQIEEVTVAARSNRVQRAMVVLRRE